MGQWSASLTQNSLACRFMHARSSNAFGHAENADQSRKTNERTRTEESQLGPLPHSLPSASNKNEAKIDGFCSGRCFSEIGKTVEEREKGERGCKTAKEKQRESRIAVGRIEN